MNYLYCAGCDRPIPVDCDDRGACDCCGETKVRLLPSKARTLEEQSAWLKKHYTEKLLFGKGFDFAGIWIDNPFWDETGRDRVDPVAYYGKELIETL